MRDEIGDVRSGAVGALDAGLRALALFAERDVLSSTDVAELVGVSRATAHRVLLTLSAQGFASLRGSGRGYVPGPALAAFARTEEVSRERRERMRRVVTDVREQTGESVHVSALVGGRVVVIDGRRSRHAHDIGLRIGMTAEPHAMAAGKLLLAALDDVQAFSLLPAEPFPRRGPATVRTEAELRAELVGIRRAGWAGAVQESEVGVASIAVPLDGSHWRDRTALVVSAPLERVTAAWADVVRRAAAASVVREFSQAWWPGKRRRLSSRMSFERLA